MVSRYVSRGMIDSSLALLRGFQPETWVFRRAEIVGAQQERFGHPVFQVRSCMQADGLPPQRSARADARVRAKQRDAPHRGAGGGGQLFYQVAVLRDSRQLEAFEQRPQDGFAVGQALFGFLVERWA